MTRLVRTLRYLFLPRGQAAVKPRKVVRAAMFLTLPPLMVMSLLLLYRLITLNQFAISVAGVFLVYIPLIWPYIANLSMLTHYVEELAADKKAVAPDLSFISNVEELSSAVMALQSSWERRRNLLEAMVTESKILIDTLPDVLILLNSERKLLRTNTTAKILFGGEQYRAQIDAIIADAAVQAAIREVEKTSKGVTIEYRIEELGRDYQLRVEKFPTYSPGGIAMILALHEVTELKRAEQTFSDFVANASHEIRTPLASLMGFIETLQGPAKEDPRARDEFLKIMGEQATRMAQLVKDLLSLSEIERNITSRPTGFVSVKEIVEEVARHSEWNAKERGMDIKVKLEPKLPEIIGDRNELVRVLTNLVINATKYGAENTTITIEAEVREENLPQELEKHHVRCAVMVAVRDRGEGIAPEHLPRLTERFYRVDKARSRKIGGTGLGLAIVRRIMDRHRGALTIESQVGEGSSFTLWLPLVAESVAYTVTVG